MRLRRALTFAVFGFAAMGAQAQTASENRDADALAADMRLLAANPLDIEALITAGEITLRMGDATASAAFFGRAEKLDPNNPRIKAGWGSLMVRAERPGMALVRFQEAERRGLSPSKFAGDRGLAYDLIGEQERAQRDYRLALRDGPDDEITRRYALSLGISGNKDEALKLLDPLIRRSDRAAWRDRAFVLAMNGDTSEAEKIAATMMSPGLGAGLTPFFRKLPQLSAADRAFAVNFGEMRTTPERIADAQLTPTLPRLGPDPYAPKIVAAVVPASPPAAGARDGKKRKKDKLAPAAPAPAATKPTEVALAPSVYVPPRVMSAPTSAQAPKPAPAPAPVPSPVSIAAIESKPAPSPASAPAPTLAPVLMAATPAPPPVTLPATASAPAAADAPPAPSPTPTAPLVVAATTLTAPPADPVPGTADQPSAAEAGVAQPTAIARVSEDTVLARIVAGLDKPPPAPAPKPRRVPVEAAPPPAEVRTKPVTDTKPGARTIDARTRGKAASEEVADAKVGVAKGKMPIADARASKGRATKAQDDAPALDKNGCPIPVKSMGAKGKAATPPKTRMTAREKANDARCKALAVKDKTESAAKGEPARIWVQVAGGANGADLRKAWAGLQSKAPDLFRGRQGWSTPLRATNRVLTGPFKSADEAQDFVNRMAKAGLSGFVFTSAKGQKIERLGGK